MQVQKATIDQPAYNQHGALLIKTSLVETGAHFYVSDSAGRIDELSKTFADRDQAAAYYLHVSKAAEQGKRVYQIVAEVQALEEAQNAATARTPDEIADAINADGAAYMAAETAAHNALVADVAAIMADGQGWTRMRHPNRPVRITRTHVFRRELSKPQIRAIRRHQDGVVRLGRGVTGPMLRSISDKGFGELVMAAGARYTVSHLVLNANGYKVADDQAVAA